MRVEYTVAGSDQHIVVIAVLGDPKPRFNVWVVNNVDNKAQLYACADNWVRDDKYRICRDLVQVRDYVEEKIARGIAKEDLAKDKLLSYCRYCKTINDVIFNVIRGTPDETLT
jgi:hypothetical protein